MDKQSLLAAMRTGRERLLTVMVSLNGEAFERPGGYAPDSDWSYKDLLAHMGYWEGRIARIFEAFLAGSIPPEDDRPVDEINREVYLQNRDLPAAEVREREAVAYQRLLGLVERASEADLIDPARFARTEGRPFADWIAWNTYGHYEEHGIGV